MSPLSVLIVDGSEVVRGGLALMLSQRTETHVIGKVASAEHARHVMTELKPNVVIVRDRLPDGTGFDLCRDLAATHPTCAVIVMLTEVTDTAVSRALESGARGLLQLDVDGDALRSAVSSVALGLTTIDAQAADRLVRSLAQTALRPDRLLSQREFEVLRLVSDGLRGDEIAHELGLTANSVRTYVRRALEKLGCSNRAEAAARFSRSYPSSEKTETSEGRRRLGA